MSPCLAESMSEEAGAALFLTRKTSEWSAFPLIALKEIRMRAFKFGFLHYCLNGFLWVILGTLPNYSWAGCGAASCPVQTDWGSTQEGWIELGYQFEYIDQQGYHIGARDAAFRELRGHENEKFTLNKIHRLNASIGLNDRFSVNLRLPYISRAHEHIAHHEEEERDELQAWELDGLGDLSVITRYAFWKPKSSQWPALSTILGAEFPTGNHRGKNAEGFEAELPIQPGSGSYDLILGLSSHQEFSVPMLRGGHGILPVFSSVVGQLNGRGNNDYRLGDTLQINLGASYPLTQRLGLITQFNCLLRDHDAQGHTDAEIQKTGGELSIFHLEWKFVYGRTGDYSVWFRSPSTSR